MQQTDATSAGRDRRSWIVGGLLMAAIVVIVAAFLASGDPDGLERVAEDQEFIAAGEDAPYEVIPDYTVPGIDGELSTIVAGVLGVVIVFGLLWAVGRLLARRRDDRASEPH